MKFYVLVILWCRDRRRRMSRSLHHCCCCCDMMAGQVSLCISSKLS